MKLIPVLTLYMQDIYKGGLAAEPVKNFLLIKSCTGLFIALFSSGGYNLPEPASCPAFLAAGLLLSAPAEVLVCPLCDRRRAGKTAPQRFVFVFSYDALSFSVPEKNSSSAGVNKSEFFGILIIIDS